ncbi:MAG: TRAP transporter substrate-binding protein [Salinarimonadaceae bacterium]|nr:MAG: TRAP transporter substrate-binding protein [Salinarimonadaceae bacterium]
MKRSLSTLAAAAVAFGLALHPGAPAEAQNRAVVNNDTGATSLKGQTWDHFRTLVGEKLGDSFTVDVLHGEALYNQMTMIDALQLNAIQFIAPVVGVYSSTFPKMTALVLPYLLPSPEAIREAMEHPDVGGALLEDLRRLDIEPVAVWLNGPRDIGTTAENPILWPDDVRGVRIRVPPGRNYVDAFEILGANPTTMAWGEVPTALRQGVIDAVEPVPNAWLSSGLYEIARQYSQTGYIWDFYVVATNKTWWEGLDPVVRQALEEAMEETTEWNWTNTERVNQEALDKMAAAGTVIHDLTDEQRQAWADAVRPLWDTLGVELVGQETMNLLIEIGDRHR